MFLLYFWAALLLVISEKVSNALLHDKSDEVRRTKNGTGPIVEVRSNMDVERIAAKVFDKTDEKMRRKYKEKLASMLAKDPKQDGGIGEQMWRDAQRLHQILVNKESQINNENTEEKMKQNDKEKNAMKDENQNAGKRRKRNKTNIKRKRRDSQGSKRRKARNSGNKLKARAMNVMPAIRIRIHPRLKRQLEKARTLRKP